MATRRTSARRTSARTPEGRRGFTLVEAAIALAVAALFCAAIAAAVSELLRAEDRGRRRREAVLWHETAFARHALGRNPLDEPAPVPGWTAARRDTLEFGDSRQTHRAAVLRFSPDDRPAHVETLYLVETGAPPRQP